MTDREKFEAWFSAERKELIERKVGIPTLAAIEDANWKVWRAAWQAALASHQPADDGWITESQAERLAWLVECIRSAEVSLCIAEESSKGDEEETQQVAMAEGEIYQFIESLTRKNDSTHQCESSDEDNCWIEWKGGNCPVSPDEMVIVKCRSSLWAFQATNAKRHDWHHGPFNPGRDIIAYRVVKP